MTKDIADLLTALKMARDANTDITQENFALRKTVRALIRHGCAPGHPANARVAAAMDKAESVLREHHPASVPRRPGHNRE